MATKTLKVRAVGDKMYPSLEAFDAGVMRFVGRQLRLGVGTDPITHEPCPGWVMVDGGVATVPNRSEYIVAVRTGDLEAADAETAKVCGVKFSRSSAK